MSRTRDPTLDMSVTISFKGSSSNLKGPELAAMLAKKSALASLKRKNIKENKNESNGSAFTRIVRKMFCRCT